MNSNNKSKKAIIIILIVIFILGILIGVSLPSNHFVDNSNTAITLIISIVALVFSMITFFSIDSVDKKNRMDHNVLDTENYTVAYSKMMSNLNLKNQHEFDNKLKDIIKKPLIKSCMDYADWIQNIIDHIIFFAYFDKKDDDNKKFIKKFVEDLDKQLDNYKEISSGIKILLSENVKLIKAVYTYQGSYSKNANMFSNIEDVRGKMLNNPITRIVYYDYLGLDYRKKASILMKTDKEEFTKEYFECWKETNNNADRRCEYLIKTAKDKFKKALVLSGDDLLWAGYLSYNIVRVEIMEFLLSTKNDEDIRRISRQLDTCVKLRENIYYMFSENKGYLEKKFYEELTFANDLRKNFNIVFKDI